MRNPFRGMDFRSTEFWFRLQLGALVALLGITLVGCARLAEVERPSATVSASCEIARAAGREC